MDMSPVDEMILKNIAELAGQAEQLLKDGKLQESLSMFESCLERAKDLSAQEQVPILLKVEFAPRLYNLGQALCDQGDFTTGIRALSHVVEIEHSLGDLQAEASVLSDIATVHFKQGHYEEAIALYSNQVLPLRLKAGDRPGEARVHRNIGLAYARLEKAFEAYSEIKTSIEKAMDSGSTQEARLGLQSAVTLLEQGLGIPDDIRKQLWQFACRAEYWDLEPNFREEKSNDLNEAAEKFRFKPVSVFLSYSHQDRQVVASICSWLDAPVFSIFLDQDRLYPGWQWELVLMKALKAADVFVLLIGNDTMSRPYVRKELEAYIGFQQPLGRLCIVPVLLPDYVGTLPPELASYQWYDLREGKGTLKQNVSLLNRVIWNVVFPPEPEIDYEQHGPSIESTQSSGDVSTKELYEAGQVSLSPTAFIQMVNMGIIKSSTLCSFQELDISTFTPKRCDKPATVLCIGCGRGTCSDLFHLYERFCTVIPAIDIFENATRLFYWCPRCHAPICTRCLGIEDDYPCPPDQVLMYRFQCPACDRIAQVVPILEVDYKGVGEALLRWSKAGGPPAMR